MVNVHFIEPIFKTINSGEAGGGREDPGSNSFIFMQFFFGGVWPNNGMAPLLGPLGNPGSAIDKSNHLTY